MPNIQITYDEERLAALKIFLEEKGKTLDEELVSMMDSLYERTVPQKVQMFLEKKNKPSMTKPKHWSDLEAVWMFQMLGTDATHRRKKNDCVRFLSHPLRSQTDANTTKKQIPKTWLSLKQSKATAL